MTAITMGKNSVAAALDVSPSMVDNLISDGLLPKGTKVRGRTLWLRSDVEAAASEWFHKKTNQTQDQWDV